MNFELLCIILTSICLLVLVAVLVVLLRRKPNKNHAVIDSPLEKEVERLQSSIYELKGALPSAIKNSVSEKMVDIQKTLKETADADNQRMMMFQSNLSLNLTHSIEVMNKKIDDNLSAINKRVDESLQNGFKGTSESMEKLQKALGEIDAAQKNIESLSGEVLSLKGILTNSQQRGRYGEMQLEMIISNLFGESYRGELYEFQYVLSGGESQLRPDAVVFLDGEERHQIIAIDAKFPITGYEGLFGESEVEDRDALKSAFKSAILTQVKQVTKYADTHLVLSPVLMFIPNDGVFAYVQNEFPEVVDEAKKKGVLLVSPTILQPIIASFRVAQIDAKRTKNLEKINESLSYLGKEFQRFASRWEKIERSVGSLSKATDDFSKTVNKIDKKFGSIAKSDIKEIEGIDPLELEEENE